MHTRHEGSIQTTRESVIYRICECSQPHSQTFQKLSCRTWTSITHSLSEMSLSCFCLNICLLCGEQQLVMECQDITSIAGYSYSYLQAVSSQDFFRIRSRRNFCKWHKNMRWWLKTHVIMSFLMILSQTKQKKTFVASNSEMQLLISTHSNVPLRDCDAWLWKSEKNAGR